MKDQKTVGQIIKAMPVGVFKTLGKVEPMGSLQARKQTSGAVVFYWRFSINDASSRIAIGVYDSRAPVLDLEPTKQGYSYAAARWAASAKSLEHYKARDTGGYPALVAAEKAAQGTAKAAADAARAWTLKALLLDYCDHLKTLGRRSHADARSIFNLHVFEAWPAIADLPATDVSTEQIADMMRKLHEAGKGRTANKLRSYVRAAFQTAKAAKANSKIPVKFKTYGVTKNPAADAEPDASENRPDKNPLSVEQMRAYWKTIKPLTGLQGAVLRLHLLTGGQRIEQLVNLKTADIAGDVFTLLDGKGRPGQRPRKHAVPLTSKAAKALAECKAVGKFALSTDGGETHISATTLSRWAADVVGDSIDGFKAKRIRSGVETLLSKAKVAQEVRGHLQSHGITGVQRRHYDDNTFLPEKREALETLGRVLEQRSAEVVQIGGRRGQG